MGDFGGNWPHVRMIIALMEDFGLYLTDIHPRNITFADAPRQAKPVASTSPPF